MKYPRKLSSGANNTVIVLSHTEYNDDLEAEMLVMERLKPLDYRSYEVEIRELWWSVFEDELTALHQGGFVHRDLKRPSGLDGMTFDNILLTEQGLRLIDVGISALRSQVSDKIFDKFVEMERQEMVLFREYFLNR